MSYSLEGSKAAVVEWFDLISGGSDNEIIGEIEHDRLDYSLRPGLIRKLLVITNPDAEGQLLGGGLYFFEGFDEAREFLHWSSYEHTDSQGRTFEEREFVGKGRRAHVCDVIAHVQRQNWQAMPTTAHVESFRLKVQVSKDKISEAFAQGEKLLLEDDDLQSLSCVYDPTEDLYFILSVRGRRQGTEKDKLPDLDSIRPTLFSKELLRTLSTEKKEDLQFYVFTIWEPRQRQDPPGEAVWPNSPPLPCPEYWVTPVESQ